MEFRGRQKILYKVSLAPLIDVVFLLLIFFLLTSNFAWSTGIPIRLPRVRHASQTFVDSPIEVFVKSGGGVIIDGRSVGLKRLAEVLSRRMEEHSSKIYFYADRDIKYDRICEVLDEVQASGAKSVVLRTEKK